MPDLLVYAKLPGWRLATTILEAETKARGRHRRLEQSFSISNQFQRLSPAINHDLVSRARGT